MELFDDFVKRLIKGPTILGNLRSKGAQAARVAETKTLNIGGLTVTVMEVKIARKVIESVNEYELDDGSTIRVSNPALVVYRLEDIKDGDGNHGYIVKNGTAVVVVSGPNQIKH
ncbi:MAG TPA: hypothetical protein VJN94_13995 [Candidatus Binataceae bacterium]|nr:hypothetical protein [Candidatus Binataceae bacterium]